MPRVSGCLSLSRIVRTRSAEEASVNSRYLKQFHAVAPNRPAKCGLVSGLERDVQFDGEKPGLWVGAVRK